MRVVGASISRLGACARLGRDHAKAASLGVCFVVISHHWTLSACILCSFVWKISLRGQTNHTNTLLGRIAARSCEEAYIRDDTWRPNPVSMC